MLERKILPVWVEETIRTPDITKEIDVNTIVDFNKSGEMIGIEILFVKERNPNFLKELGAKYLVSA